MIKLISDLHPPSLLTISPTATTISLEAQMMATTGQSFEISLTETSNNRTLPRDEVLLDEREYFINYLRLPVKGGI